MDVGFAGSVTFGGEILKALSKQDSTSARAAGVLSFILEGNEAVKKQLLGLTLNLAPHTATPPTSLLTHCVTALSNYIYTPGNIARDGTCNDASLTTFCAINYVFIVRFGLKLTLRPYSPHWLTKNLGN